MNEDRFIVLTVAYETRADRGPSLGCIAPELRNAGLSLIEDKPHGWNPSRRWAGLVDGPTFCRFADAWHLHDENHEPASEDADGHATMHAHTLDGMNWEAHGDSPIIFVTVHVWVLGNRHEAGTRACRPLPFARVG